MACKLWNRSGEIDSIVGRCNDGMAEEPTAEEACMEYLVERVLERAVLSRWAPTRRESEAHPSPTTGGSKLHLSPTDSPLGDDE